MISDICKIIFAIILPPLGVFLERGCGADFLINILLTIVRTHLTIKHTNISSDTFQESFTHYTLSLNTRKEE